MTNLHNTHIKRALISVSDKTGVVEFAQSLTALGVDILSTGGTARLLAEQGLQVTDVSAYTGFPEIMQGRVKTLHPKIHGGLLGRRDLDAEIMQTLNIPPIDLLVVNLYPFEQVIAQPNCDFATAIENIDIGGPAMLRSAAKNHASVTVITDINDYANVLTELNNNQGCISADTRLQLAKKAFARTAEYDTVIANFLYTQDKANTSALFPDTLHWQFRKRQTLRYGENAHQQAALYIESEPPAASIAVAEQHQGKPLSYNNIADSDAALECVKQFTEPTCVIVKHANPCGVASADSLLNAYERAYQTDPTSAFGGIIACNQTLDLTTAQTIIERQFVEVIIAPAIEPAALDILAQKPNIRALSTGLWRAEQSSLDFKRINGGVLMQDSDTHRVQMDHLQTVTQRAATADELDDLLFAWRVAKFVKSNAIVYARQQQTLGIGAGQMSRVDSTKIAAIKAAEQNLTLPGAVMASDAFFPFRDSIDAAHKVGIRAIIQPGGSKRDAEVIAAADEYEMTMVLTGIRHFRH